MMKCLLVTFLLAGAVWAQSDSVSGAVNQLPTELQGKVDQAQITEYENQLNQRCEKNGGQQAYANAQKAINETKKCFEDLVNTTVLQEEIKEAKPNGRVDEVFKKYCAKKTQLQECFHKAVEGVKSCFSSDEQSHLPTLYNITDQLAEFVCFKDGDRIALFIAEGGPECFQDRQESIQECWNSTLGVEYKGVPTPSAADSIPKISFGPKQCGDLTKLQNCVVKELEACEKPTTANIVESLFKFAREVTPCSKYDKAVVQGSKSRNANPEPENKTGSASGLVVTSATLLMAVAASFLA